MALAEAQDWSSVLTEYAVRDWLRTQDNLRTMLPNLADGKGRIDVDYDGESDTFLTLFRGGGDVSPLFGWDRPVLNFHCYGSTRHAAARLETELVRSLQRLSETPLNGTVHCVGASVLSRNYSPVPGPAVAGQSTTHARYIVIAAVVTHATAAAV